MRWNDRQVAMLEAMGVRMWQPPPTGPCRLTSIAAAGVPVGTPERIDPPPAPPETAPRGTPPRSAVAALDWPALRAAASGCTACRLCESRRQVVFGTGHERAEWMIVGEAPGEAEDEQGEPFVGRPGRLLDNMLRAIGLTRDASEPRRQVYVTNTVKCRAPGNRSPVPDEFARCEPYLMRQVTLVQPKIILAMGRFAVQALLRSTEPIGRLRGRVHEYQGRPLVATYHPNYLLRHPEDKARAWEDLCLAAATFSSVPG